MFMLAALATAATKTCRVEDAHYALRKKPAVTATFRPVKSSPDWPADVALGIHFGDTGRTYWWLPWAGGTDDKQNVASTTDVTQPGWSPPSPDSGSRPLGNMEYVGTNARYDVIDSIPRLGGVAPAHMLFTSLGDTAWHRSTTQRDSAPKQFFDLIGCSSVRKVGISTASSRAVRR